MAKRMELQVPVDTKNSATQKQKLSADQSVREIQERRPWRGEELGIGQLY